MDTQPQSRMQVLQDGHAARDYQDERFSYVVLRRGPRKAAPDPSPSIARTLQGEADQPGQAYQPPEVIDDAARRARLAAQLPVVSPEVQALIDASLAGYEDSESGDDSGPELEGPEHQPQRLSAQVAEQGLAGQDEAPAAQPSREAPEGASQLTAELALAAQALKELDEADMTQTADMDKAAAGADLSDGDPASEDEPDEQVHPSLTQYCTGWWLHPRLAHQGLVCSGSCCHSESLCRA